MLEYILACQVYYGVVLICTMLTHQSANKEASLIVATRSMGLINFFVTQVSHTFSTHE